MATEFDSFPVVQAATEDPFAAFPLADDGFDAFPLANAAVAEEEIAGGIKMVAGKEGPLAFVAGTYIPTDVLFPEGKGFMAGEVTPERYEQALAKVNAMTAEEASKIGARVDQAQFSQSKVVIPEAEQAELSRLENAQNEFSRSAFSAALQPAQALALADRALFERSELGRVGEIAAQRGQMFEGWQQSAREAYPTDPRYQGEFLASTLPQAAGSVLPFALAGQGGAVLSSSVGALMTAQSEYDSAKAAGASEEAARKAALVGLPIGLLEGLGPIGKSFDRPGGFKSWLGGAIKEGMQEVSQSGLQTLNASYISRYDPNRRMSGKELLETGAAGALIGGGMTAVPAYLNRGVTPDDGTGIIPEEEGPDYDSILREIEDRDEPDLSGFGYSNPAAQTPAPPAITPEQQISATILGEGPAELRQQEAIVDGTPAPAVVEEVVEEEVVEEPVQEAPILDTPEAVEAPLAVEEGQDTTQASPEATAAPEGLSVLDPDSYERLADEPVAEGYVAYQDPATNDIFQVPQDATPEIIQVAREKARSESLEAEFEMLRKEQQRLDEVVRAQKQLLSGPPIYKKSLVPAEPVKTVWRDVEKLTFTLDREKGRLAEARKNLARLQSSANQRAKQDAAEEVKVRTRGVEILQSRVDELTPKVEEAKKAVKGMKKKPNQGEAGFVTLPQPLVDLGIALHRGGVEFREWSRSMLKSVGDQVRPFLKQIWDAVVKAVDSLSPANRRAPSTSGMRRAAPATEGGAIGSAGGRRQPPPPQTPPAAPQTAPEPLSIKNENTAGARDRLGMDPRVVPFRRAFGTVWEEAMIKVSQQPGYSGSLVSELAKNPRPTSDLEGAVLLYERVRRENEYDQALAEVASAQTEGDVLTAQARLEEARLSQEQLIQATEGAGTSTARGLAIRKMLVNREYNLERMRAETRAVENNGGALTPEQNRRIEGLYTQLKATQDKLKALEEKQSQQDAAMTFKAMMKEMTQDRKDAVSTGKSLTEFLNEQADKARERLKSKMAKVNNLIPDPTILVDISIIGASHIANGIKSITQFTNQIISEFGEDLRPYIPDIFEQSQKLHDSNQNAFKGTTKAQPPKDPTPADVLKQATGELDPSIVFQLARAYVRQGMTGMENVMNAVHADLEKLIPGLTVREIRDAFSGYGKVTYPSKAEDLVKLRQYKVLARLTSQLEDVYKRQAPLRTGPQRDKLSAEARILQKQINDLMKELGITTISPEQQLKTAADAVKTRLRNQIEELDRAIQTNQALPTNRRTVQYDEEAKALQARRNALKERYDSIFKPKGKTQAEKIQTILANLDRSIEAENQLLKAGILKRPPGAPKPTSTEIENKRMELDAMRQLRKELFEETQPKLTAQQKRLQADKKIIRGRIKNLQEKIAKGDYSPASKKDPQMDKEKRQLQYDYQKLRETYLKGLLDAQLKQRKLPAKIWGTGVEALNTSRAILTSADFSGVLRQGGFIAFGNPVRTARALPSMFKAFASEKAANTVKEEIRERPNYPLYQQAKLYLADDAPASLSQMEEAYMSRWANKIPIVAGSQRAYITFLNKLRADSFDAMVASLTRNGTPTKEEAKAIANFVNVATGRGDLGKLAGAGVALNTAFFAPRYVLSRFQLLAGQPFYGGNARTRKLIAKEYAKYLTGIGVVTSLLSAAIGDDDDRGEIMGFKIPLETDPRSSDFLKVRIGNTRLDPFSGLLQATTLLSRVTTGETKQSDGDIIPLRGKRPYGSPSTADVIGRFLRTKLSPIAGTVIDLSTGENVVGEPVGPKEAALRGLVPISASEIVETMKAQGIPMGTALSLLSMFGVGLQTYQERAKKAKADYTAKPF